MLTEAQKTQFVEALENECFCGITEDQVASTRDTVQNFIEQWGAPHATEQGDGMEVFVWNRLQTRKGAARGDLYVVDFGGARATYFSGEA